MTFLRPDQAMTEAERQRHPILTGLGEVVSGLASPGNVEMMAGSLLLGGAPAAGGVLAGEAPEAASLFSRLGSLFPRLMSAGFGAQFIYGAYKTYPEVRAAADRGDTSEVERLLTHLAADTTLGTLALTHAATGRSAVTGKAPAESTLAETKTIEPSSPTGEALKQPAPDVRVVDSAATKNHLESQATVPIKVFHGTAADVGDISKLDARFSKTGVAGRGIYVTESAEQAGKYAGPEGQATGGRVVAGLLNPDVKLLAGNDPLPSSLLKAAQEKFGDDIDPKSPPKTYLEFIDTLQRGLGDVSDFQKEVARAGYDGVRYTAEYPGGPRSATMLFGTDISGRTAADLLRPTVPTARIVSDDYVPIVSQSEILSETVQRMLNNSRELQKLGLDTGKIESRQDVATMLDQAGQHIERNLDPRVGRTISFDAQKQLASELGMDVEDLLARKSGEAWNAEKAVAARALLRASQTRVMNLALNAAQGDEAYQQEFSKALAQHQELMSTVRGVAAEAGRALGSFRIKESELPQLKISDAFSKLSPDALTKAAQLLSKIDPNNTRQVNEFVEKIRPSTTPEKIFEYYRNALLSSPKTVTVKAASEAAMMALETTKKAVAGGLAKLKGDPQQFASESWWFAKGAMQALTHAKAVLSGEFNLEDAPGFEGGGKQAIKGTIGKIIRFPGTLLSKQTNLMYVLNYFGELNAQAARVAIKEGLTGDGLYARQEYLVHNPTPEMIDAAHQTALHNTFQNELGKFGRQVQGAIRNEPTGIAKYLFPFFKTPVNLVKASGEFSPYGLVKGLVSGDTNQQASGLIGSSLATGIAYLALNGHITGGGPIDFRKKETLESTGWQPYSVKIGGKYVSYHRFEPLGLALGLVADAVHGIHSGDNENVAQSKVDNALSHIQRNVTDFPFLMGLSNLVDAIKDTSGKRVNNFISRQVAGFVPAAVANVAEATDRTVRHPEGISQTVQSRIPGMTQNVPPVLDVTGKTVQRPASQLGGANPFPVTTAKSDPVVTELTRLGVATPQPPKSVKLRGKTEQLTQDEALQIASAEGRIFSQRLAEIMQSKGWTRLNDDQRRQAIRQLESQITRQRPGRLANMRDERLSAMNADRGSLDELLDLYPLAGPKGKSALEPVIFSRIVDFRAAAKRGEIDDGEYRRMQDRIAKYVSQVRETNAA